MRKRSLLAMAPLFLLTACGGAADDSAASTSAALDSTDSTSTEGAILASATDGASASMTGAEAAQAGVATSKSWYQPASCLTTTAVGPQVTYTLNDCTGPWGLVHVTGSVVVVYAKQPDGIHATATSTGLHVNGAVVDLNATGVYSVSGTTKKLVVTTDGSGTGARGNSIARTGSYTVTWDATSMCGTLDGDWSTKVGLETWATSVSGYERCKGMCPAAGGTISHSRSIPPFSVTVSFDGSATAHWSTSNNRSGTVALLCL